MKPAMLLKPVLMFLGLAVFGLVIGFLSGYIGSRLLEGDAGGWGGLVGAIAGMVIGYPLGVITGMVLVKTVVKYPGSLLLGIPAVIVGAVAVIVLAEVIATQMLPSAPCSSWRLWRVL